MKQVTLLLLLLPLFIGSSCSKDEEGWEDNPYYDTNLEEIIVKELSYTSAYIVNVLPELGGTCTQICYSSYAVSYFVLKQRDTFPEKIREEIREQSIGVETFVLKKKGLPLQDCLIRITASVTSIRCRNRATVEKYEGFYDAGWDCSVFPKAYIHDIKIK